MRGKYAIKIVIKHVETPYLPTPPVGQTEIPKFNMIQKNSDQYKQHHLTAENEYSARHTGEY
jgi:hypothetical protein